MGATCKLRSAGDGHQGAGATRGEGANSGPQETGTKGREPRAEEGQTQELRERGTKEQEATRGEGGKLRSVRDGTLRSGKPHAKKGANAGASEMGH